jgi:hypothetical protein
MKATHTCPVCDSLFFPTRSDAVYCSARCRKRAQRSKTNRNRDETQAVYNQARSALFKLQAYGAHRQIRALMIALLNDMPDEERVRLYEMIGDDFYRVRRENSKSG